MIIPKGKWFFRSKLGHYNMLYPVEEAVQTEVDIIVNNVTWPAQRGLTPWSTSEGAIIWCDNYAVIPNNTIGCSQNALLSLFVVCSTGYYTAIQGSIPTKDRYLLERLSVILKQIKPGADKYYLTTIVEVDDHSNPTDISRTKLNELITRLE